MAGSVCGTGPEPIPLAVDRLLSATTVGAGLAEGGRIAASAADRSARLAGTGSEAGRDAASGIFFVCLAILLGLGSGSGILKFWLM